MNLHPMKLVTIVCEAYAQDSITTLLRQIGAHGWTLFAVQGDGSQGRRHGDIPESTNIQLEVILQPDAAHTLLDRLEKEFFTRYAMIAFESDVRVLRPQKF